VIAVGDPTRQENFDLDLRDLAPATPSVITSFLLRRILEPNSLRSENASDWRLQVADSNWPEASLTISVACQRAGSMGCINCLRLANACTVDLLLPIQP
jgi:hypothetical protein